MQDRHETWIGKSLYHPQLCMVDYITPNIWNGLNHPLNFPKPVKLPPKAVSKNHSKSQKNHKMENPIVLDSKWVDLHSEYIIWYALVYFFYYSLRSMLFFIAVKKCTKTYHIIYSLCRSTHLESNTIRFFINDFSVIYYDFLKLL